MPLDPQVADLIANLGPSPFERETIAEMRIAYQDQRLPLQPPRPDIGSVEERDIAGPGGPLPVRLYTPLDAPPGLLPCLVYLHGGGWVLGSLEGYETMCRTLANRAACRVLSLGYRPSPENKFPAAVEDTMAALRWLGTEGRASGVDASRIAIGGDSAGGNLAAVAAQLARAEGGLGLVLQILVYPALDLSSESASYEECAEGYMLSREAMRYFIGMYLEDHADKLDTRASPLLAADFAGLAAALVITAEFDPLRDEGEAYAEALVAAGVAVEYSCYEGMVHPFVSMGGVIDRAAEAEDQIVAALQSAFGSAAGAPARRARRASG